MKIGTVAAIVGSTSTAKTTNLGHLVAIECNISHYFVACLFQNLRITQQFSGMDNK